MTTIEDLEKRVKWLEEHYQHGHRYFWDSITSSPTDQEGNLIIPEN
jgi:hypothetical protein